MIFIITLIVFVIATAIAFARLMAMTLSLDVLETASFTSGPGATIQP